MLIFRPFATMVQFEEDFKSRTEKSWSGGVDGYLRPDQFLDHLTVIIIKLYVDDYDTCGDFDNYTGCKSSKNDD